MLISLVAKAVACGPFLASALVSEPDEAIWAAPVADFGHELRAISPPAHFTASNLRAIDMEAKELVPFGVDVAAWYAWRSGAEAAQPALPPSVPRAWVIYAEGAARWHRGNVTAAVADWRAVLALPEAERRSRAVWAAFMLARAGYGSFDDVFALVDAGYPDPLGLAVASWGERGRERLWRYDWRGAVDDYLAQVADGGDGAALSLELVVRQAIAEGALDAWAADPVLQRVATAWIASRGGPTPDDGEVARTRAWLRAVQQAEATAIPEADHLAWLAYQVGDIPDTAAWLDRSPRTPLALWLRGKLLLREGRLAEAEALLAEAAAAFPAGRAWSDGGVPPREGGILPGAEALAEAGLVRLARQDWTGALDAFVASGHWVDAAYVAERLLTVDALRAAVDRSPPAPLDPGMLAPDGWARSWPDDAVASRADLRYLLARRLVREGRADEALPYFPEALRQDAARYAAALHRGREGWSREERASERWTAALLARTRGLELMGTELEPDFAIYAGEFDYMPRLAERFTGAVRLVGPGAAEEALARANAPRPDLRWHYRVTAAALAAEAARELPDRDPRVRILLCRAARWSGRDEPTAEAYRAEARRRTGRAWTECGDPVFAVPDAAWLAWSAVLAAILAAGILAAGHLIGRAATPRRG